MDKTLTIALKYYTRGEIMDDKPLGIDRWPWVVQNAHGAVLYSCSTLEDALHCAERMLRAGDVYDHTLKQFARKPD